MFKGPLMPFSKTVALLFEVSTALRVSLPLLHILSSHGYQVLLRERGYSALSLHRAPHRPANFLLGDLGDLGDLGGTVSLSSPSHTLHAPRRASQLQASLSALLTALHGEGELYICIYVYTYMCVGWRMEGGGWKVSCLGLSAIHVYVYVYRGRMHMYIQGELLGPPLYTSYLQHRTP